MTTKWCMKVKETYERSLIVFQCHLSNFVVRETKNANFNPIWAFPDWKSKMNALMAMKWHTKLKGACFSRPLVQFHGHIGQTRSLGRSQLSNLSDLPCFRSSVKFQGHTGWKIDDLNPIWVTLLGRSQLLNSSDLPWFFLVFLFLYNRMGYEHMNLQWFCEKLFKHLPAYWPSTLTIVHGKQNVETMTKDKNTNKDMKMLYKWSSNFVK